MIRNRIGDASEKSILVGSVEAPDSKYEIFIETSERNENGAMQKTRMFLDGDDVTSLRRVLNSIAMKDDG